ncbi:MAG TPA: MBL fold metallo-hydrolase [Candidatus Limnocylindrales bacterium]|nr:MBL fold metallo-hydrolase [Candidatus Limnocylindrales bacterium]
MLRDGPYRVTTFAVPPYDNNVYVLQDPRAKEAILIDAANEAPRILEELEGLRVTTILTTHGHPDHVQALRSVRGSTHASFACHPDDAPMMPIPPDHRVKDGETFRFGAHQVRALHTPGHTPGSICFLIDDLLFSGDTLFPGGPGNTSNPNASFETIIESIRSKLFTLPDDTRVLPGHGKATTIGSERPHLDEWIARGW